MPAESPQVGLVECSTKIWLLKAPGPFVWALVPGVSTTGMDDTDSDIHLDLYSIVVSTPVGTVSFTAREDEDEDELEDGMVVVGDISAELITISTVARVSGRTSCVVVGVGVGITSRVVDITSRVVAVGIALATYVVDAGVRRDVNLASHTSVSQQPAAKHV